LLVLLVLLMVLLMRVMMLVGGRLLVFASRGLQPVVLLHSTCSGVAGVGSGAGSRPAAAPCWWGRRYCSSRRSWFVATCCWWS
jgi:hypothetical protein